MTKNGNEAVHICLTVFFLLSARYLCTSAQPYGNSDCKATMYRRLHKVVSLLLWALLLCAPSTSFTATLVHDELRDGDLTANRDDPVLPLEAGNNVVSGTTSYYVEGDADFDGFSIFLKPEAILKSVTYSFELRSLVGSNPETEYRLLDGSDLLSSSRVMLAQDSSMVMFEDARPQGANTFQILQQQVRVTRREGDPDAGWTADYSWNFEVEDTSSVPIPGTLALIALPVIAIVGIRYTRQWRLRSSNVSPC